MSDEHSPSPDATPPPDQGRRRIFRNTLWLTGALVAGRGLSYLGFIVIARIYTEQEVGIWAVLLTACLFAEILSNFGLDKLVVREIVRSGNEDGRQLLSSTLFLKLGLSLLVAVAAYAALIHWYPEIAGGYSAGVGLYLCIVPCIAVTRTLEAWHTAGERMHVPALAQVFERFSLLLVIGACWVFEVPFVVFLVLAAIAPFMRFLIVLRGVAGQFRMPSVGRYKSLLGEGLLLFAVEATAGVYLRVDILLISQMRSLEAAAQYNAAFRLFEVFTVLFAGYLTAVFPSLVRKMHFESLRSTFWLGLAVILAASGAGILSRNLLLGMFGPAYLEAGQAFIALMLTLPLCYTTSFLANFLVATGRVSLLLGMSLIVVSTNILLNLVLIPRFSITGAASSFLLSEIVSCILLAVVLSFFKKRADRPVEL